MNQILRILLRKASDLLFEKVVDMSEHELIELLKTPCGFCGEAEYVIAQPNDYYIDKYGPLDFQVMNYDSSIED